ncbi:MAG: DinB family protein [Cyclobacteriaceae bacterium]
MTRAELIDDLTKRTQGVIKEARAFRERSPAELNERPTPTSWTILECLEHLSLYGDFYIPEIKSRIEHAQQSNNEAFKSGWLGNYFAISMLPGENGKLNKIKTFKNMNPIHKQLSPDVIDRFLVQQDEILSLLDKSSKIDLGKVKTAISISKLIKLKLGDTLRVVIYHNQRHIKQALKLVAQA